MAHISNFKETDNVLSVNISEFNVTKKPIFNGKNKYQKFLNTADLCNMKNHNVLNKSGETAYYAIIVISSILSIASMLCICLVIPTMFNYVSTVGTFSMQDFSYCEVCLFIMHNYVNKKFLILFFINIS